MKDNKGRIIPLARWRHDQALALTGRLERFDPGEEVLYLWYADDDQLVNYRVRWAGRGYYRSAGGMLVLLGHVIERAKARMADKERAAGLKPPRPSGAEVAQGILGIAKIFLPIAVDAVRRKK